MSRRTVRPSRFWETVAVVIVKPLSLLLVKRDWRRSDLVPGTGGIIIAANHLSWTDPLLLSHFLYSRGRWPVVLAKAGLFGVPILGHVVRELRVIPVHRASAEAAKSLEMAERRLREGGCLLFYPEGTITRDPDMWPMEGKTGVARLALTTGAPVVPIAHWGAQEILPYGRSRPKLFPRRTFKVLAGPAVDLSAYDGLPLEQEVLRAVTADIMVAITAQLAELRGQTPNS